MKDKNLWKKVIPCTVALVVVVVAGVLIGKNSNQKKLLAEYKANYAGFPVGMTVTAHTGCMGTEENSIDSIQVGMKNADIVEFDVRFNADGVPVLAHDEKLKGNEVLFEDALKEVAKDKKTRINIDLKDKGENLKNVYDIIKATKMTKRVFFTGVGEEKVSDVKKYCPKISYYLNMDIDKKKVQNILYINEIVEKIKNSGAVGLNVNFKFMTRNIVKAVQDAGLEVSLWTVDKELDMYKVVALKPNNITTRNPDKLNNLWNEAHNR